MKHAKRILSLLMVFALLFSSSTFAVEPCASSRIDVTSASVRVLSSGDLYISFSIIASDTMSKLGASSVAIERYNGSKWVTEYTYTAAKTSSLQTSDNDYYSSSLTYSPTYSNASYRAVVNFIAEDSTGSSTATRTTSSVTS